MPATPRPRRLLMALFGLAAIGLGLGLHITAKAHDAATTPVSGPVRVSIPLTTTQIPRLISIDINAASQQNSLPASQSAPTAPDRIPVTVDDSGPVQTSPRIYAVFVGNYWQGGRGSEAAISMSQTLGFYRHVGESKYNQVLAQYRGAGANARLAGAWIEADATDDGVDPVATLQFIMGAAQIPTGTQTQVDLIYPPGVTFSEASESAAVGYHSWANGVTYAAVSSLAGDAGTLTVTVSHEYVETVSDPITNTDSSSGFANHAFGFAASTTSQTILEVADVCEDVAPVVSEGMALARIFDARTATCVAPSLDSGQ